MNLELCVLIIVPCQQFVLAASDICTKLKMIGYWSDFINPFSGQPYNNIVKTNTLRKTNQYKRSLDFKIDQRANCKLISYDKKANNFIGKFLFIIH